MISRRFCSNLLLPRFVELELESRYSPAIERSPLCIKRNRELKRGEKKGRFTKKTPLIVIIVDPLYRKCKHFSQDFEFSRHPL